MRSGLTNREIYFRGPPCLKPYLWKCDLKAILLHAELAYNSISVAELPLSSVGRYFGG